MKRILIFLTIALFATPVITWAQSSPTDAMFKEYSGKEGYTTVHISKELFSMMSQMNVETDDPEAKEMIDAMSKLDFIRILMADKSDVKDFDKFKARIQDFDLDGYKELMLVKEGSETVRFMVKEKGDKTFGEMLMLIDSNEETGFISIVGSIDINTISKLSKSMNMKGMEKLEELNKDDK
ncbi:MAG: DUF4252 domain-containing protein [Bacteroidetes bacterium]|nr:DUF4252 domain-containing protein [Bacteroidota bacterium]